MTETRRGARSRATQMTELPNGGVQVIFDSRPTNAKKGKKKAAAKPKNPPKKSVRIIAPDEIGPSQQIPPAPGPSISLPGADIGTTPSPPVVSQAINDAGENPFFSSAISPTPPSPVIPQPNQFYTSILDLSRNLEPVPSMNTTSFRAQISPTKSDSPSGELLGTPKRPKIKRSRVAKDIWPFIRVDDKNGDRVCKLCEQAQKLDPDSGSKITDFGSNTSTTTIRKHFYSEHFEEWVGLCGELGVEITSKDRVLQQHLQEFRARSSHTNIGGENSSVYETPHKRRPYSHTAFVTAIMEWVISDDQALNVIENPKLRAIFLMLRKDLRNTDIPHRSALRTRIMSAWDSYMDELEQNVSEKSIGKCSFTTDLWSDPNLTPYMAVTMHWIYADSKKTVCGNQFELKFRADLVGFFRVPHRHTGQHLGAVFLHILKRIKIKKIGWITLDNASNNDKMMEYIQDQLTAVGVSFNKVQNRIRCFPHIVNLAVQSCLASITDVTLISDSALDYDHQINSQRRDPIAQLRDAIRAIRSSSHRRDKFAKVQVSLNLAQEELLRDVPTRWSSTQLMIECALKNRPAIDTFLLKNQELYRYRLMVNDWSILEDYSKILIVPHAFQQRLSFEKIPVLGHVFPSFRILINKWELLKLQMPGYASVIDAGLQKLYDYHKRMSAVDAYTLAILLHPERKLEWFRRNAPDEVAEAEDLFLNYLHQYRIDAGIQTPRRPQYLTSLDWADEVLGDTLPAPTIGMRGLASEVDAYFGEGQVRATSPLAFWQENQLRYPTIFLLAMDILPIQASSVPCERVFSSAKETVTARRSRINSDLMEALQVLKFSVKYGGNLNFTEGLSREAEISFLRDHGASVSKCPEDLSAFTSAIDSISHKSIVTEPVNDFSSCSDSRDNLYFL